MDHTNLFPCIPARQTSDRVHPIGITMMSLRKYSSRADIHSIPDLSFHNLVNADKNKHLNIFYYISQRDVLLNCIRYGERI